MEKVLVALVVPSIGKKFDVYIPIFLTVQEVIPLLAEALTDLTGKRYVTSGNEFLCSGERQVILNQAYTIEECGIQNGERIYLF